MVFLGRRKLKLFDKRLVELDHLSALDTDQVIVMVGRHGLISAELVVETVFFDESLLFEGMKGAVDGRESDPGGLGPHQPVDLFCAQMGP